MGWYAFYILDKKEQALAIFGLEEDPCPSSMTQEGSKEAQQPVTAPSKKRKMLVVSAKNTNRKRTKDGCAQPKKAEEKTVDSSNAQTPAAPIKAKGKAKAPKGTCKEPPLEAPEAPPEAKEAVEKTVDSSNAETLAAPSEAIGKGKAPKGKRK